MMGDDILVAPMFTGEEKRQVVLPGGKWYDFYTGAYVGDTEVITIEPGLDNIPLFVKDGGIIPMIAARNQMPKEGEVLELEIRHYGMAEGSTKLYDDDGISFDYEKGAHSWADLTVTQKGKSMRGTITIGNKKAFGYHKTANWVFMTKD